MRRFQPIAAMVALCLFMGCEDPDESNGVDVTPPPSPLPVPQEHPLDGRDLDALSVSLKDPDPEVEAAKERARLTSLQNVDARRESAIQMHIANLRDKDPEVRQTSAQILGQMGALEAIPDLIEALKDSHVYVQIYAHGALNKLTGKNFGYKNYDGWTQWWKGIQGDLEAFTTGRKAAVEQSRSAQRHMGTPFMDPFETYREMLAAAQRDPKNPELRNGLALAIMELARENPYRYIDAIDQFAVAIRLDPSLPQPRFNIGACFSKLGKEVEARDWYHRGLEIDTQGILWEHAWHLGKELLKKGDYTAALEFLDMARAKAALQNRVDVRIHRDLALTCYALDRFSEASREINAVKELGYDLDPTFVDKVQAGLQGKATKDP